MIGKYLVDSNVLIYALDTSEKEKHEKAKQFMVKASYEKGARLSVQNLAEFYVNITGKRKGIALPSEIATQRLAEFSEVFRIIKYGKKTVIEAAYLQAEHKIHFWDSLLAATMIENGIKTIYTENTKDFSKVPGIKAINPVQ